MNRILQADVILTLTAQQARVLLRAVNYHDHFDDDHVDLPVDVYLLLAEQCSRQGVEL